MCGIAGWYRRGQRPVPAALIAEQCDILMHRGPDDAGCFTDGDLGMGMRRLSIIDPAGGHQPMETPDRRYTIVLNGEIYNHLELRPGLEAAGYRFTTHSDTETLLAAFACWGDDVWLRLEGMYAAAIWDRLQRTLTLARDPLGIKPLYVTEQQGGIGFASELNALRVLPRHEFDIDERAVHDFFSFGHVQRPRSIYRQVRQLDPGHVVHVPPAGAAAARQFWKPRLDVRRGLSESEWIEATRAMLLKTVKRHMLADVPIGSFLSGGIDSSAVTAAMARQSPTSVTAFTIGFPGQPTDETAAARRIAAHLGCDHVVWPVDLLQARDVMPIVQRAFDEPSGASAAIPTWYLSKLAARQLKVVLCGEGGDELFAGYKRHRRVRRIDRWSPLIRRLAPAVGLLDDRPGITPGKWNVARQRARGFCDSALLPTGFQRFIAATQIASPQMRRRIYDPGFLERQERSFAELEAEYFPEPEWRHAGMLQQFMLGDLCLHMPSALLSRLDRLSMAHSLEARVPLLSHDFVDWSLTMPLEMKTQGVGKYALREAVRPWLPEGILDRPKQGFQMPLGNWFAGDFADFAREAWHESGAAGAGYLLADAVDVLFEEHHSGRARHGKLLYAIAMFSCWWTECHAGAATARRAGAA